jgi:nicotinamidase-related amidase
LNNAMRDAKLEAFIIAGIALEVGIAPTVRHGADLNYIPIVVTDACGSRTAEDKERVLSEFVGTGEILSIETAALLPLLAAV